MIFPDVEFKSYLCEWLLKIGPVWSGGMGAVPIPHTELAAWAANQGIAFSDSDAEWLYLMSVQYSNELSSSDGKSTPAPYEP
ncbi:MAG: hypothetical protein CML61_10050 [Rhodobacteraceae bacterium]|nr:hypothetical protein [Paracoccaceae bacterium]